MQRRTIAFTLTIAICATLELSHAAEPIRPVEFAHARITDAWETYADKLTFGAGQTLALVDDGCKLSMPEWKVMMGDRPKVLVAYDAVDGDDR